MLTYIFPGQGSQYKGMGGTNFDEFPEIIAKADEILGYSIKEMCINDPRRQLNQTRYTQPALYIVNVLSYLKILKQTNIKPDYVAGHSLGEYSALFASGAFDFETGLKLVIKRGELMSQATGGSMAAVLGLNEAKVENILRENGFETIEIANYNTPTQIVISGSVAEIEKASELFEMDKVRYIPLNVSGAFHSRYMDNAKKGFEEYLDRFKFSELTIPVISNVHARPYRVGKVKENLAAQIIHSVKWTESIRYLMGLGEMELIEIGPGDVLTKLVQSIRDQAEPLVVTEDQEYRGLIVASQLNSKTIETDTQKAFGITATSLGDQEFKKDYNLKYAYLTGAMYRGIASKEMVVRIGKVGMMGFFGTGGLDLSQIDQAIQYIHKELSHEQAYGMNLLCNPQYPEMEEKTVDLYLEKNVRNIEAAAFLTMTPALVRYRAKGLKLDEQGNIVISNRIIGKISRPEVALAFLSTAPERIVAKLLKENKITQKESDLLKKVPMADDLCAEADSGGHTDGGVAFALIPAIIKLRDEIMDKNKYSKKIRVGAAGGIGTPEAAAAAFILGADFIVTGSINQCTVEARTSDTVKDLLQQINVQDTEYAPAGDMFELGAKVQVLKKGLFFPARSNKLYDLYRQHNSISEIDLKTKTQIQEKYFKRSFEQVYADCKKYCSVQEIQKADRNSKYKMALIFKWYFGYSSRLAFSGNEECKVDYQVHCGPALGAFNQWVKGTGLEDWHNRHVEEIGIKVMEDAAKLLNRRFKALIA